ncbi:hypothetical protein LXL04_030707 [Taraxacum kok-saghyz]
MGPAAALAARVAGCSAVVLAVASPELPIAGTLLPFPTPNSWDEQRCEQVKAMMRSGCPICHGLRLDGIIGFGTAATPRWRFTAGEARVVAGGSGKTSSETRM